MHESAHDSACVDLWNLAKLNVAILCLLLVNLPEDSVHFEQDVTRYMT